MQAGQLQRAQQKVTTQQFLSPITSNQFTPQPLPSGKRTPNASFKPADVFQIIFAQSTLVMPMRAAGKDEQE